MLSIFHYMRGSISDNSPFKRPTVEKPYDTKKACKTYGGDLIFYDLSTILNLICKLHSPIRDLM